MQKIEPKFLITQVDKNAVPQPTTPGFPTTIPKPKVKYIKPKIPKTYYDITDRAIIETIAGAIRFQLPSFGIHRPQFWKNRDSWGIVYKILAEVEGSKLKNSHKTNKFDIMQLKWKCKKQGGEVLKPFIGYTAAVKDIDQRDTAQMHQALDSIIMKGGK